jgi:hypothetical protein
MKGMECESEMVMKTKIEMEAMIGEGKAMNFMGLLLKRREVIYSCCCLFWLVG